MNSNGPDDVLSQGHDEQFDPPAPDAYECPICLLILREAVQTECGHRFCRGCILKVVREGRPNCPIDNETLSEDLIYTDNFARKEILGLNVHCHNYMTHGCPWLKSLRDLPSHMESCEFSVIRCPDNCGEELQRKKLQYHLEEECVLRIVGCLHCDRKMTYKMLNRHYERCTQYRNTRRRNTRMIHGDNFIRRAILDLKSHMESCEFSVIRCPNNCGEELQRKNLQYHLDEECVRRIVACLYCDWKVVYRDLTKHCEECPLRTTLCPYDCGEKLVWEELAIHCGSRCPKMKRICQFSKCNFQGTQIEIDEHTKMHEHRDIGPSNQCSSSG